MALMSSERNKANENPYESPFPAKGVAVKRRSRRTAWICACGLCFVVAGVFVMYFPNKSTPNSTPWLNLSDRWIGGMAACSVLVGFLAIVTSAVLFCSRPRPS